MEIVDGSISAGVLSSKFEDMIIEAIELANIHKNIIIKVPMINHPLTDNGIEKFNSDWERAKTIIN